MPFLTTSDPMPDTTNTHTNTTTTAPTSLSSAKDPAPLSWLGRWWAASQHIDRFKAARESRKLQCGRELNLSPEQHWKLIECYEIANSNKNELMFYVGVSILFLTSVRRIMRQDAIKRLHDETAYWQGRAQGHEINLKLNARLHSQRADLARFKSPMLQPNGQLNSTLEKNGVSAFHPTTRFPDLEPYSYLLPWIKWLFPKARIVAAEGCQPIGWGAVHPFKDGGKFRTHVGDTDPFSHFLMLLLNSISPIHKVRRGATALREREGEQQREHRRDGQGQRTGEEDRERVDAEGKKKSEN